MGVGQDLGLLDHRTTAEGVGRREQTFLQVIRQGPNGQERGACSKQPLRCLLLYQSSTGMSRFSRCLE